MIFIVIALFAVTYLFMQPILHRKLNRKETAYLFVVYLCVGLIVRSILFVFGM
jgi:glycopeptide antibiotics resistance protein